MTVTGTSHRFRPRALTAAALPVRDLQHVDRHGQQVLGRCPLGGLADLFTNDRRVGREVFDEGQQAPPGEAAVDEPCQRGLVEPLEVRFEGFTMLEDEPVEPDEFGRFTPT